MNTGKKLGASLLASVVMMATLSRAEEAPDPSPFEEPMNKRNGKLISEDGTISVRSFELPVSEHLNAESQEALRSDEEKMKEASAKMLEDCPVLLDDAALEELPAIRQCRAQSIYTSSLYDDLRTLYPDVTIELEELGGVLTEVFLPKEEVSRKNQNRVLINLHGGGMKFGSRWASHFGSIPVAKLGRIKVVSVDYRQAPEAVHPAASEDVAAVYRELLKEYRPENIGIYGCSAGGQLTAWSLAWFQKEALPTPGAVGMFGGAASTFVMSDSHYLYGAIEDIDIGSLAKTLQNSKKVPSGYGYSTGQDVSDPMLIPGRSPEILAKFPPSLLLSASRDKNLGQVLYTHSQLIKLGVEADLHVWEGLGHCFNVLYPNVPESRERQDVIVEFFDKHLGTKRK